MKIQVVLIFSASALLLAFPGCGKKEVVEKAAPVAPKQVSVGEQVDAAPPPVAAPVNSTAPAPPAPAEPTAVPQDASADDLTRITHAIQSFAINNMRPPADLNELVKAKLIPSIPKAPSGKKYLYDPSHMSIKLVNQ